MNLRPLRIPTALLLLSSALLLHPAAAVADGIYVISHPGVTLDAGEVREVFLGERSFADNVKLTPVDNAVAQGEFLKRALKLSVDRYSTFWAKSFRDGIIPPPVKSSDAEVIEFVRRTPGAIGYVSHSASGVKLVGEF